MSDTTTTTVPSHVTKAQIAAARGYLQGCLSQVSDDPARIARIDALTADEVYDRTLRMWPEGWAHFCEVFASDIRNEEEEAAWLAEAQRAAFGLPFARRLPQAALWWFFTEECATCAVRGLGRSILAHRHGPCGRALSWTEIARNLDVPVAVAVTWAAEYRVRQAVAFTVRPLRRLLGRGHHH